MTAHDADGTTVLAVDGAIDLHTARDLHDELQRRADEPVIVDLRGCDFIDSTSVGVLLRRYRVAPALTRVVAAPGSTVAATLAITLHHLMPVDPAVEAATRALRTVPASVPVRPTR